MTQISMTDDAIVRKLESCSFPGVTIMSAPHEWDAGYIQRLLTVTPALLVAFLGADDPDDATELNLMGRWAVYAVAGWHGKDQKARRIGVGAGFDLLHRAAAALHLAILTESNGAPLTSVKLTGLDVLTDSSVDIANLWIGGIDLKIGLPLPLLPSDACYGPLNDFLQVRATFDLPGGKPAPDIEHVGTEGDVPVRVDLDQT